MENALSAIPDSALLKTLHDAEALITQTKTDSLELLKGASISPKMVMRELSRVLTESADLLIVLTQDLGLEKLDDILQQNPEQLMSVPPLAT